MVEKMKVVEVKFSEKNDCVEIVCANLNNTLIYATLPKTLSVKCGDYVWVFYNENLIYKGYHAVAVLLA